MIPLRFKIVRPYLASFIHRRFERPGLGEVIRWLIQPGKEKRASCYITKREEQGDFMAIHFCGFEEPFYYPRTASWIDLCQTVDEVFNPKNWHHFVSEHTPIHAEDTVVDCGAAEGLFSFYAAKTAKRVYAIEPIPMWHPALEKTFPSPSNVEVMKVGVGHTNAVLKMTDDEIYSRVSSTGKLDIPIRTLDSLFTASDIPVSFLKADIEGFEFPMLLGAEELIRKNRPKISMTVYHGANHFVEIREFLRNIHADYRIELRGMAENGNPVLLRAY